MPRWLKAGLLTLLALLTVGCSERSSPWESKEARVTHDDIASCRALAAAQAKRSQGEAGPMVQPARGPALPAAALPERLRPGATGARRAPLAPPRRPLAEPKVPVPPIEPPRRPPVQPPVGEPGEPPPKQPKEPPLPPPDEANEEGEETLSWIDAIAALQAPRAAERLRGALALGKLTLSADQIDFARERLREASADEDSRVRKAAALALKKVGK